jgi:hypothetical protein
MITKLFFLVIIIFSIFYFLFSNIVLADSGGVTLTVTVSETAVCGNGVVNTGEQCDGSNLNGESCISRGYAGGSLSCNANCTFNTSSCTSAAPASSGGGGGGGGGGGSIVASSLGNSTVIFSGRAYPKSAVTLLKDAQVAASTIAGSDANFTITLNNLSAGNYIFSVYGEDKDGIRSNTFSFTVSVTANVTTNVGGIFIAPTIAVDKSEVKRGEDITFFGQTVPNAKVLITINSDENLFAEAVSAKDGVYLRQFDTTPLEFGSHSGKSKTDPQDGSISSFSSAVGFVVGTKNVAYVRPVKKVLKGDVNGGGRVNLIDFSIVAYWYKRANPPAKVDLNGDGKVDLIDLSIMAYYWTG